MGQNAPVDKAGLRLVKGLSALLLLVLVWAFLALSDVTQPLIWWILLFVGINGVLYGGESLAGLLLLVAKKLGTWA